MNRLREVRESRGWSRPRAADELESLAHKRRIPVTATRDSLIRYFREWEHGRNVPQQPYRDLLAALYGKTFDELGLASAVPQARSDVGLVYAKSLLDAVDSVASLARFDEQRHPGVVSGQFSEEAIYAACLDWLFGGIRNDLSREAGRVLGRDVEEIVATTAMFDGLDRTFSGEHSRDLAIKYLREVVVPRLRGTYSDEVGRSLFQAAAVLCEIIGYMAYDSDRHSLAQRYFVQSLRFAKEAGDSAYGAYVLNTMSHQAMYLGRSREALRLAQVARQGYTGTHMPTVQTEAAMLEARAHAALSDSGAATRALQDAERYFALRGPDDSPNWAAHWTDTVFSSFAGHGWLDLGNAIEARPHLIAAADNAGGQPRRVVFSAAQLSRLAILEGDIEQALRHASAAANAATAVNSKRSLQVIRDLRTEFDNHSKNRGVEQFLQATRHLAN